MIRRIILCLGTILIFCSSIFAQSRPNMKWQLGAGISNPTGDLGTGWSTGFHGRVAVVFLSQSSSESNSSFGFLSEIAYHSFPLVDLGIGLSGGTFSSVMVGGGGIVYFAKPTSPTRFFLMATLGLGVASISELEGVSFESESKLYFSPTAGVQIGKTIYLSAGYVSIALSGSPATYFPITVGVNL